MQKQENNIKIYDHNSMKRVLKYFYYPLFLFNNAVINKIPLVGILENGAMNYCEREKGKILFISERKVLFSKGLYIQ